MSQWTSNFFGVLNLNLIKFLSDPPHKIFHARFCKTMNYNYWCYVNLSFYNIWTGQQRHKAVVKRKEKKTWIKLIKDKMLILSQSRSPSKTNPPHNIKGTLLHESAQNIGIEHKSLGAESSSMKAIPKTLGWIQHDQWTGPQKISFNFTWQCLFILIPSC